MMWRPDVRTLRQGTGPALGPGGNGVARAATTRALRRPALRLRKGDLVMSEVRLSFVGTGGIARSHLRKLAARAGVKLVGFCDVDKGRAEAAAGEFAPGAGTYEDWRRMLDEVEFDACYVCLPPHVHEDLEVRLAEKGAHLFVEKPVSLYLDEAIRAREAIRKAGVMSCAGYSQRYTPAATQAEAFFKTHEAAMAHVRRWGGLPPTPWWRVMDQSGGQLHEMVTHQVDLLRAFMGDVEEVSARYSLMLMKAVENLTVPDVQAMLLRFDSGAVAAVTGSCALRDVSALEMDFIVEGRIVSWSRGEGLSVRPEGALELPPLPESVPDIDEAFVRALQEKDPSPIKTPFDEAVLSAGVTLAANESARTGAPVRPVRR